jgi:hypothetical protein
MTLQHELYQKELGLDRVERKLELDEWLGLARREAARIDAAAGRVSINELHDWARDTNTHPPDEKAYSAVFRGKEWVDTGMRVQARHKGSHAREVRYWRYESTVYKGVMR